MDPSIAYFLSYRVYNPRRYIYIYSYWKQTHGYHCHIKAYMVRRSCQCKDPTACPSFPWSTTIVQNARENKKLLPVPLRKVRELPLCHLFLYAYDNVLPVICRNIKSVKILSHCWSSFSLFVVRYAFKPQPLFWRPCLIRDTSSLSIHWRQELSGHLQEYGGYVELLGSVRNTQTWLAISNAIPLQWTHIIHVLMIHTVDIISTQYVMIDNLQTVIVYISPPNKENGW